MAFDLCGEKACFTSVDRLPDDSLARRENWPGWAVECIGARVGREAVEALSACRGEAILYLGTPFLEDLQPIRARVSTYTKSDGNYAAEPRSKITLTSSPAHATMRSTINRPAMRGRGIGDIDNRCWSGTFTCPKTAQIRTITTRDMAQNAYKDPCVHYVAAVATGRLGCNPRPSMHDGFLQDFYVPELNPTLIVPVTGRRDLPPDMLVIDTKVTRREAAGIFELLERSDQFVAPGEVTMTIDGRRRSYPIAELGQLAFADSAGQL